MIPLESVIHVEQVASPQVITHFNILRSAEIDGSAAPGKSSGDAIDSMDAHRQARAAERLRLRVERHLEGRDSSREEPPCCFSGWGILVVYLTLAAQYESFSLPFIVLLAVPMALLGALVAVSLRGLQNDVYCQIGLVMLIGLSSKNAILIVEFAEQLRERGLLVWKRRSSPRAFVCGQS